jgi:glycosyltransferase involved in cell wall biosynthesis
MSLDHTHSIFSEYYGQQQFVDRFTTDASRAVDVLIPIIHTNEIWRANLVSIYREVPVNRLILGDGGCIDGSIDVAKEFPRVEVLDHRDLKSLGFSIRHLIEATKTDWFVYLHSDVFLPNGWFDAMCARRGEFDWFECNQRITVMADYLFDTTQIARSYSGSQMGRRAAFEQVTLLIDDDYLYRNEDIIIAKLVERAGHRYGKVGETHHFHQVMYKPSRWQRRIKRIQVEPEIALDEDIRANRTYALGVIKYLDPSEATPDLVESVRLAVQRLVELDDISEAEFLAWVKKTNPRWSCTFASSQPAELSRQLAARARTARRIHYFADMCGVYGAFGASVRLARLSLRRVAGAVLPRAVKDILRDPVPTFASLLRRGFGVMRAIRRRILEEYRAGGFGAVYNLFKRRLGR